jgi:hypothetical protein
LFLIFENPLKQKLFNRNLPKIGDKNPDPYVKIYKIPDKVSKTLRENKNKSGTKRNTCNPVYEET